MKEKSPKLQIVRDSYASGEAIAWVKVHRLPDYVYFNHRAHVSVGVSCVSCHGRVDQMVEVRQVQPLSMAWCLECHRNPAPNIRPARSRHPAGLETHGRRGRPRRFADPSQEHQATRETARRAIADCVDVFEMSNLIQLNPASLSGRKYWRSLDALADSPEVREWAGAGIPGEGASEMLSGGSRRTLLKLMAAGFGLAGLTACRRPVEHILPLSKGFEGYVHGRPLHYATISTVGGVASGIIVEASDGRPTKVEGNPRHPYSLGATSAHTQATVLNLYDPDRLHHVSRGSVRSSWDEFAAWWKQTAAALGDGAALCILAERSSSPTLAAQKAELARRFPKSRWLEYDSVASDNARQGAQMAFGQRLEAHYQYDKAAVVCAIDNDFLGLDSPTVLPTKQFSARRRAEDGKAELNRLYVAEANFTTTGAKADHRLRLRCAEAPAFVLALAKELNISGGELKLLGATAEKGRSFITALAKDLLANQGRSVVVAGPRQSPAVHAVVALINQALSNHGQTVSYTKPVLEAGAGVAELGQLAADVRSGVVKTVVTLGGNPLYTLPADVSAAIKPAVRVALAFDENETAASAEWRLPEAHEFECWGDAQAADGTASIQQPIIEPLYGGRSVLALSALLAGTETKPYDLVKAHWAAAWGSEADRKWKAALHDGVIESTRLAAVEVKADIAKALAAAQAALKPAPAGLEVVFYPSSGPYDGRFANNAWLQEAPDPMTKLVWDNAALLSPSTARRLGVANGDMLELSSAGQQIRMPAMALPGHADNSLSLALGYGRSSCGRVGTGVGHRAELLRTTSGFHIAEAEARRTGQRYELVSTQEHDTLIEPITGERRNDIVNEITLADARKAAHEGEAHHPEVADLFPPVDYSQGYQWGMAIDLNACVGCNACLVACQAENNIAVVGKQQVQKGREMHWIRMDRYFSGDSDEAEAVFQPMACQQCEKAPCESVCPVAATTHSPEGLNEMVYNRCVGTRYCANNCPYKVRRFNFLNWNKDISETRKMVFNPDVTVRMRGVMEKCNYCVQRIEQTRSEAKSDGRRSIRDGEVKTACQQVCPADAIIFGNLNDPASRVVRAKRQSRDYAVIEELNTRPRTTYLANVRNPNPELA